MEVCRTCTIVDDKQHICRLTNRIISEDTSTCDAHRRTPLECCEKCGVQILNPFILMDAVGNVHLFCNNCIAGAKV